MINPLQFECIVTEGIITFKNSNAPIGFTRFNEQGEVEYMFVNPMFGRKGLAKKLFQLQ